MIPILTAGSARQGNRGPEMRYHERRPEVSRWSSVMATIGVGAEFVALCATAVTVGTLHTLLGPDHYVPFAAMARAGNWSAAKTLRVTAGCGLGHVAGSAVIGLIGLGVGTALTSLEILEGIRGDLAAWLLIAFGLSSFLWGLPRASGGVSVGHHRRHAHGPRHRHHSLPAAESTIAGPTVGDVPVPLVSGDDGTGDATVWAPWMLFLVFVFGPCEPLIPLLLVPAAKVSPLAVAGVVAAFAGATVATMTLAVMAIHSGIGLIPALALQRWAHPLAGLAVLLCGVAIKLGL